MTESESNPIQVVRMVLEVVEILMRADQIRQMIQVAEICRTQTPLGRAATTPELHLRKEA